MVVIPKKPGDRRRRTRRSPRANVSGNPSDIELIWISKRGRTEVNEAELGKPGRRFYIQEVSASPNGSYWDTVETAADETYAINRATSLALTESRSFRVARHGR